MSRKLMICFTLLSMLLGLPAITFAQNELASKLEGDWKISEGESIESWQKLGAGNLKGIAYKKEGEDLHILEYLELSYSKGAWVYTAQVPGQNDGKKISFKQLNTDTSWCFENKKHDFPKRICYTFTDDHNLMVRLTGDEQEPVVIQFSKQVKKESSQQGDNPNYDAELAAKLNADEYGMKPYMLVMLKSGSNSSLSKEEVQKMFEGHLANIGRLVENGKMIVAGPLGPNPWGYRGIFILDAADQAEVDILLQTDPAIANDLLAADVLPWYGSAALSEYLPASDKIWLKKP